MGVNNVIGLSKIIENESNQGIDLAEVCFAINEIEKILDIEKSREIITERELLKTKNSCIRLVTLGEYLDTIKKNIDKLDFFLEVLYSKKRILEYKTKKIIPKD